jgi:hypothetical protein
MFTVANPQPVMYALKDVALYSFLPVLLKVTAVFVAQQAVLTNPMIQCIYNSKKARRNTL